MSYDERHDARGDVHRKSQPSLEADLAPARITTFLAVERTIFGRFVPLSTIRVHGSSLVKNIGWNHVNDVPSAFFGTGDFFRCLTPNQ